MSQLMLVNPRRKKRSRRRMSAKQAQYFGKRRRRRSHTAVSGARNPRRRRRHRVTVRARRNPTARAVRRARRSGRARTMRGFGGLIPGNLIKGTLIPAAVGGAGALAVDVAWGFLPLPANIKTGPLAPVAKIAAAILVGGIASKVAGKAMGEKITGGYLTVMAYNFAKGVVQKAMPSLPLGGYDMGYVNAAMSMPDPSIGAYITGDVGVGTPSVPSMGAYMNEYDNSYNS